MKSSKSWYHSACTGTGITAATGLSAALSAVTSGSTVAVGFGIGYNTGH